MAHTAGNMVIYMMCLPVDTDVYCDFTGGEAAEDRNTAPSELTE